MEYLQQIEAQLEQDGYVPSESDRAPIHLDQDTPLSADCFHELKCQLEMQGQNLIRICEALFDRFDVRNLTIVISGDHGAGKTTLVRILKELFESKRVPESEEVLNIGCRVVDTFRSTLFGRMVTDEIFQHEGKARLYERGDWENVFLSLVNAYLLEGEFTSLEDLFAFLNTNEERYLFTDREVELSYLLVLFKEVYLPLLWERFDEVDNPEASFRGVCFAIAGALGYIMHSYESEVFIKQSNCDGGRNFRVAILDRSPRCTKALEVAKGADSGMIYAVHGAMQHVLERNWRDAEEARRRSSQQWIELDEVVLPQNLVFDIVMITAAEVANRRNRDKPVSLHDLEREQHVVASSKYLNQWLGNPGIIFINASDPPGDGIEGLFRVTQIIEGLFLKIAFIIDDGIRDYERAIFDGRELDFLFTQRIVTRSENE